MMRPGDALLQILIATPLGSIGGGFWSKLLVWRTIEVEWGCFDLGNW